LEAAAEPYYQPTGRKGIAPGVYFRMLFIGYFEVPHWPDRTLPSFAQPGQPLGTDSRLSQ
jgi:hypothetical protein